ncbi:phospho-N-acetylmuramoyl-pentapeptide-transferase [Candidatus Aquicultor secundus]|nr:phospho-N-acetylmuramoyl-pentapeptide-transferase [Candidatus Aquicultor secundus]PIU27596.1 MAG: phospho-N-acetylmuramoyl-pentapeptide-transferase [Candidatus Aquicultor secundus]
MITFLHYPTYQIFLTAVLALVITAVLTPIWIKLLRREGIGQVVRIDGPQKHLTKSGTPTMGGVVILFTVAIVYLLTASVSMRGLVALMALFGCGLVGFIDDYRKVVKARSLGLKARSKIIWQLVIAILVGLVAVNFANLATTVQIPLTHLVIPLGSPAFKFSIMHKAIVVPILYITLVFIIMTATTNTVNLTDGLDGLAAGTVTISMLAYAGIAFRQNRLDLAIICAAVGGAAIGFLWFNSYPASIFMGDTGSLGLGGVIAIMAILTKTELLLVLIGGIYVIEGLSVIGQIVSYRWFKRRILKMAPIHHHFEMQGWSETQIMMRFWIISGIFAGIGFGIYFMTATSTASH